MTGSADSSGRQAPQGGAAATLERPAGVPLIDAQRPFDVCHVGLVLRAVLGVQLVLALGLAVGLRDAAQWPWAMASGTVASLTGVLAWLLMVCGAKPVLARLPEGLQWAALMALGALCALAGAALLAWVSDQPPSALQRLGLAGSGALAAAALLAWLKLRARAQAPADALARLVELQSRIRPHFLFNTLNTAIALVRVDPSRAEQVLEDLSELFRGALADASAAVSLAQEIELARRYLDIEQLRFGERLRIVWELDARCDATPVPPLLLQPLVENAVRHGVEPNDAGGELLVRTRLRGAEVEILVRNSVGAPSRGSGHGLALRNVRERLLLTHDVAARLDLDPGAQQFTVRIVLPR